MRKKFFFFDKCYISTEPKDMMAFKHDPELFTLMLKRNIGLADGVETDFNNISLGIFNPEAVRTMPIKDEIKFVSNFVADVKEYNANNIKITVTANDVGLFTYTDLWDEGWHVRLDGKNAPLRKVFRTFKGVFLTPGVHEVEFYYRNKITISIWLMNIIFFACLLGLFFTPIIECVLHKLKKIQFYVP
ncbi:MAG: hypothetical protein HKUEN01_33830 [Candidatus Kuenenia stuttgartiensis]|nr:MAG: hypothetical protein HKUEN01_33830 [Candidatus Kuenenia stuttgartiensis]